MNERYLIALVVAGVLSLLYGAVINWLNHRFAHLVRPIDRTAQGAFGVALALLLSLLVVPAEVVLRIFGILAVMGAGMGFVTIIRSRAEDHEIGGRDKDTLKETMPRSKE